MRLEANFGYDEGFGFVIVSRVLDMAPWCAILSAVEALDCDVMLLHNSVHRATRCR